MSKKHLMKERSPFGKVVPPNIMNKMKNAESFLSAIV